MICLLLFFFVIASCSVTKNLGGRTFNYKSKKRTLQLIFDNDSICRLKNTFHCNDIDLDIKELITTCKYKRVNDRIYLTNIDCKSDSCEYDLIINIPIQNSKECDFLNKEYRTHKNTIGPNYTTEFKKYGSIPQIDIDTLYIQKNKILLYKQKGKESIGFIFK